MGICGVSTYVNRRGTRTASLLALALVCALAVPATSGAATKFDTSYQNGGTLLLPQMRGVYGQVTHTCGIAGKNLHIAGRFGRNEPGLPSGWNTSQSLALTSVKIDRRQPMSLGVATVRWKKQRIPTHHVVLGSDFDHAGGFAYATRWQKKSELTKLKLFRVDAAGSRLKGFGRNGYVTLNIAALAKFQNHGFRVLALPRGKVLLLIQTKSMTILMRFTAKGKPDPTWGSGGVVELPAPASFVATPLGAVDSASETDGGGLLIASSGTPTSPAAGALGILKLSASGKVVTSWADGGFWTPPAAADPSKYAVTGRSLMTVTRKGGDYAVLYADVKSEEIGATSELRIAYVDEETGVTTASNADAGSYYNGGDEGFPDANPWALGTSSAGPVFAFAQSRFDSPGGTFLGRASRFSINTAKRAASHALSNTGFATSAFAADPASRHLYFCGSFGVTSVKAKRPERREQRRYVAIRRITL